MTFDPTKNLPGGIEGKLVAYLLKFVPKEILAAEERREQFPDEPWLWETGEASTTILPYSGDKVKSAWGNAFFLNIFLWAPVLIAFNQNFISKYPWTQILVLLPILASLFLLWAAYQTLQKKTFATSQLCLDTSPLSAGTNLSGTIEVPVALRSADRVDFTLTCYEAITTGSGDSKRTKTNPLWTATQTLPWKRAEDTAGSPVPVHFELPHHIEGTSNPDSLYHRNPRKVYWSLWVIVFVRGLSMRAEYKVPIYRTQDSPPLAPPDYAHSTWQSMGAKLSVAGIYHSETTLGHHVFKTQVPRSISSLFATAIVFAILGFATFNFWNNSEYYTHSRTHGTVFLCLIVAGALRSLLFARRVEISRDGLELRAGTLGFRRTRIYTPEDIASLSIGYVHSSGKRCDIHLHTVHGQKAKLLCGLPDRAVAEELIALISATLVIPTASTEELA